MTEVVDVPEASHYELREDGKVIGRSDYHDIDGVRWFTHAEVDPDRGGQGLGSRLAQATLDDVRERGLKARPVCPFYSDYLHKHPEYADIVA